MKGKSDAALAMLCLSVAIFAIDGDDFVTGGIFGVLGILFTLVIAEKNKLTKL